MLYNIFVFLSKKLIFDKNKNFLNLKNKLIMARVTIVGAGNVGATVADVLAQQRICSDVVLLDIVEGRAEGKALDIWESAPMRGSDTKVIGVTSDFAATAGSEVVVITSGVPRKPGQDRADLISINAKIVKDVTENIIKYSPNAKIIIVSNPLDVMTYAASLAAGNKPKNEVFGMAGMLDSARYRSFIALELGVSVKSVSALLMGGHGDTMVPLPRYTTIGGIPLPQLMDKEKIEAIIKRTQTGGGEIVKLIGTSAWIAPANAVAHMVQAVLCNCKRIMPVCAYLEGQYGLKDVYIGVPAMIGNNGVEKVLEIELNDEERGYLDKSHEAVKEVMATLDGMNIF